MNENKLQKGNKIYFAYDGYIGYLYIKVPKATSDLKVA